MMFGAFMAYVIIVVCGTMGSPNPIKVNMLECGIHNNCTIAMPPSIAEHSTRYLQDLHTLNEEKRRS